MLLDGHFILEHGGRNRSGRFFNFNGTAGVWRRTVIADAGGWQHDTLTEDLDLSYRAQMKGWRFVFLQDVVSPAELPVEMNAFKSQQHRWAKGSIQTCKKLLPRILASTLPLRDQGGGRLPPDRQLRLPADDRAARLLMFPAMVHPLQHGLLRDDDRGRAALPGRDDERLLLLPDEPARGLRRRAGSSRIRYLPGGAGGRHRHLGQQREGRAGGAARHAVRVHAHAQVPAWRAPPTSGSRSATAATSRSVPFIELLLGVYFTCHGLVRGRRTGSTARCRSSSCSRRASCTPAFLSLFENVGKLGLVPGAGEPEAPSSMRQPTRPPSRGVRRVLASSRCC